MKVAQGVLAPVCPKRERLTLQPELSVCACMCVWKERRFPLLMNPDLSTEDESFCNNHMPVDGN